MLSATPILAAAVPVVGLVELSGGGATVGTNFNKAIKLAVKELMDVRYDAKGDIDRESFFVKIVNGRAVVEQTLKPTWAAK